MAQQKEKQQTSISNGKRSHSTNSSNDANNDTSSTKRPRIEYEQTGYNRNLVPESLMGATDIYDGELMFLYVFSFFDNLYLIIYLRVKWKGISKPELVPSRIVNKQSAQLVIKFYEDRLTWNSANNNNNKKV